MTKELDSDGSEDRVSRPVQARGNGNMPSETSHAELKALRRQREELLDQQRSMDARLFDYRSLLRASRALHNTRNLDELLTILQAMILEKLDVTYLRIFLFDAEAFRFNLWSEPLDEPGSNGAVGPEPFSFDLRRGILWQLLCEGEPISVLDLEGRFRFHDFFMSSGLDRFRSMLWLPLVAINEPVGFVSLGRRRSAASYGEQELEFLRTLGEQASVAINSVRLWQQFNQERQKLDRTIGNLSVLYDNSRAVNQIEDMKSLLLEILDKAIQRVDAQKGSIMLYEPAADVLKLQVVRGLPDHLAEELINSGEQECRTFKPGEGIAGRVFQSREPYIANEASKDSNYEHCTSSNISSILCIPLLIIDEAIGVINITNKREAEFDEDDIEILTAIASQAAVTIEKADLYRMAITDELTNLYVRRYFNRRLDAEMRRHDRYRIPLSLLMLDIDHFKHFNDTYGHDAGDRVLQTVSDTLKAKSRTVDVVARYGGEEFAILLPETEAEGAVRAGERFRQAVEAAVLDYEGKQLSVAVSAGVCEVAEHTKSSKELLRHADIAMYRAKGTGRNRVVLWVPGLGDEVGDEVVCMPEETPVD